MQLIFKCGCYSRAAFIQENTVCCLDYLFQKADTSQVRAKNSCKVIDLLKCSCSFLKPFKAFLKESVFPEILLILEGKSDAMKKIPILSFVVSEINLESLKLIHILDDRCTFHLL